MLQVFYLINKNKCLLTLIKNSFHKINTYRLKKTKYDNSLKSFFTSASYPLKACFIIGVMKSENVTFTITNSTGNIKIFSSSSLYYYNL